MDTAGTVVVVGASLAGWRAAQALRAEGHRGRLVLVGAEPHFPYDRPPLSKQVLTGRVEPSATDLGATGPEGRSAGVQWKLGVAATGLDLDAREVTLADGAVLGFDGLVIATGAHARPLPGGPVAMAGVHLLRTRDDAAALRSALEAGPRHVAIIGAGFIGLEVASSCRTLNLDVTVVEVAPVPLWRALGTEMGQLVAGWHRDDGVDLRLGVTVEGLLGGDRVEGLLVGGGGRTDTMPADLVVVGVGATPSTAWLQGSGVDLADGVLTDGRLRVLTGGRARPDVVTAGDIARWPHPGSDLPLRVEHWTNAVDTARVAATSLLGRSAPPFAPVPYFWSDQLGRKLQMVGVAHPDDDVVIVEGSPEERRLVAAYGRKGRLVAALGFGRPARVMALQRAIEAGAAFPPKPD